MKTKTYKFGSYSLKTYFKTAGHGYEVGFCWGNETTFVGNFVHKKEATKWWGIMNRELRSFTKKYWVSETASTVFYKKFFTNYLYKTYYTCLDQWFNKYTREYTSAFKTYEKKYFKHRKHHAHGHKLNFKVAA